MPISYYEQGVTSGLTGKRNLSRFITETVAAYRPDFKKVHLNYIFCDDAYLLVLNQRYLEHDTLTDVITFDLGEVGSGKLEGEIYISTERVRENAAQFAAPYADELLRVVFHGMLHLCGYKDKSAEDAAAMRAEEDKCIAQYKKLQP